jgi:hypothetical protein
VAPATVVGLASGTALAITGRRIGLAAPAVYGAAVAVASSVTGERLGAARLYLPLVFPTMHLSWGVGFLVGPPRPRAHAEGVSGEPSGRP